MDDKKIDKDLEKVKEIEEDVIVDIYAAKEDKKFKKTIFGTIIAFILLIVMVTFYNSNFIHNKKYAFKFNNIKVERTIVDKLKDNFDSEEEIAYFIMDTLTYAEIAEEQGITVTDEEIEEVSKEFSVYQKEIALSNKLLNTANEKTTNLTEEELEKFYEETKDSYVKTGTMKFLGLNSESLVDPYLKLTEEEIKEYPENEDTIEHFLESGLLPTDLELDKFILVDIGTDDNGKDSYRYIYIYEKDVTEYYTFEESKDYLKEQYDRMYGASSILEAGYARQQSSTVEYYN